MLNLDPGKLIVIGVVAIILLGPDRLPQVARQVGGAWRSFNEFRHRMETEVRSSMPDLPPTSEIARLARSPSALLNHLSNMSADDADQDEAPDGTFQRPVPPVAGNGNGNGNDQAASPEPTAGSAADVPAAGPAPPVPGPAPAPAARPPRPPGPSDVVVPSDPTLN